MPPDYTRDAFWLMSNFIDLREWRAYGTLAGGVDLAGISCLSADSWLGFDYWYFATIIDASYMDSARITEQSLYSYGRIVMFHLYSGINSRVTTDHVNGAQYSATLIYS